jgi:SSS family solute:Na+ symporter
MLAMLGVGLYFNKNKTAEDFMLVEETWAVGISAYLSATDVGVGSQLVGGLGFTMGISGSWMLFTGLFAWLCSISDSES